MLKNIDEFSLIDAIKQKIFQVQCVLVQNNNLIYPFVVFISSFLITIPFTCALFAQDIFQPVILNKILGVFSLYSFPKMIPQSQLPIQILVDLFTIFVILLTILHYYLNNLNSFITKVYGFSLLILSTLFVPFNQLAAKKIKFLMTSEATAVQYVRFILMMLTVGLNDIILLVYAKLYFAPLRKNNKNWQLDNSKIFKLIAFLIAQTITISVDGVSVLVLLISIACIIYLKLEHTQNISINSKLMENQYNVLIAFYIGCTFSLAFNKVIGFQIAMILFFIVFLIGVMNYIQINAKNINFPLCYQSPQVFYDYFFKIKQKSTSSGTQLSTFRKSFKQVAYLHLHNCKQDKCYVRKYEEQIVDCRDRQLQILQQIVDSSIHERRNDSMHNQLVYHLWLSENGKNYKFKQSKLDKIEHEYIRAYTKYSLLIVEDHNNHNSSVKQSNLTILNKMFFQQIYEAADSFSAFYEEVAKANPRIENLLSTGSKIEINVKRIKTLFGQLVSHHYLNFKSVQLYLDFLIFFLNEDILDADMIARLKKIQRNNEVEEISQSYIPCLTIASSTGNIDNVNMEMIKVLNLNKYQIKTKPFSSLIFPEISFQDFLKSYQQRKDQTTFVFLRKNNGTDFVCMRTKIVIKQTQNAKFANLFFEKEAFSNNTRTMMLINNNFQLLAITKPEIKIKTQLTETGYIKVDVRDVYEKDIYILKDRLEKLQIIKIQQITEHPELNLQIHLMNYIIPNYFVIFAKFYRGTDEEKSNFGLDFLKLKKIEKNKKFIISYDEEFNKPLIRGQLCRNQQSLFTFKKTLSMGKFQRDLHMMIVNQTVLIRPQYSHQIKTYRLFDSQLYNVDLEDKQAYNDLFQNVGKNQINKNKSNQSWVSEYCIVLVIILLSLAIIGLGVGIIVRLNMSMSQIETNFIKAEQIQDFLLDFNRLLSVMRQIASGQYAARNLDWVPDIKQSYKRLQVKAKNPIFYSTDYTMIYNELKYRGNLNQLVQVINAHVFELIDSRNFAIIENIHQASIQYVTDFILSEKNQRKLKVQHIIKSLETFNLILIILICVGIAGYYILLLGLCYKLNKSAKQKFLRLMVMSDAHALWYQQNAEKVKHLVQMVQKNFEVEMENFLSTKQQFKIRKRIKQPVLGKKITRIVLGIGLLLFAINLAFSIYFQFFVTDRLEYIAEMERQSEAITQLYSRMCSETNRMQHLGQIRPNIVQQIMDYMTKVENLRTQYYFSQDLIQAIDTLYFQNSCQFLIQKNLLGNISCSKTCPGYLIQNPFQIGLSNYFRRMHFLILNDLPQTFASTGIFSELFVRVYLYLAQNIKVEGAKQINQAFIDLLIYTCVMISLNFIFMFVAVGINWGLKKKINRVKQLIYFLNLEEKQQQVKSYNNDASKNKIRKTTLQAIAAEDEQNADLLDATEKQNYE